MPSTPYRVALQMTVKHETRRQEQRENAKNRTEINWQDGVKLSGGYAKYRAEFIYRLSESEVLWDGPQGQIEAVRHRFKVST